MRSSALNILEALVIKFTDNIREGHYIKRFLTENPVSLRACVVVSECDNVKSSWERSGRERCMHEEQWERGMDALERFIAPFRVTTQFGGEGAYRSLP